MTYTPPVIQSEFIKNEIDLITKDRLDSMAYQASVEERFVSRGTERGDRDWSEVYTPKEIGLAQKVNIYWESKNITIQDLNTEETITFDLNRELLLRVAGQAYVHDYYTVLENTYT